MLSGSPVAALALSLFAGGAALLTICVEDPKDKEWAVRTWHSVYHPDAKEEEDAG